jgi:hypothetical protein
MTSVLNPVFQARVDKRGEQIYCARVHIETFQFFRIPAEEFFEDQLGSCRHATAIRRAVLRISNF